MTWFQSHDLQNLSVHISWWAPSFRCGNYFLSLDIFRGPGPDTFYFRDWKGRGKKYWDVMVLCFNFLGLRFPSRFFSPFFANLQRANGAYGGRIKPCLILALVSLLSVAHRVPSTSPPSAIQEIDISPSIPLCDTAPLKWERLGIVLVHLYSGRTSVHQCTLAGVIYWWLWRKALKEGMLLLTLGPLSFLTCQALV